jgi:hypothetical protein
MKKSEFLLMMVETSNRSAGVPAPPQAKPAKSDETV